MPSLGVPGISWNAEEGEPLSASLLDSHGVELRADWAPQDGSQNAFLRCPVFECLYEGTRGPGKTDALIMDFAQHVGQGYGAQWRGILFRRTYPELQDVIDKTKRWFPLIFPTAKFNEQKSYWTWPSGERLFFRQFIKPSDYWSYHGHAYPWIAWEELTTWPDDKCYKAMFSCARSTVPGIPIKVRATANPYGPGHNWVKMRWGLPIPPGKIIGKIIDDSTDIDGDLEPPRTIVHGHLSENKILLHADPEYINRLVAAARNPAEKAAWIDGDWNIVAGGMFDDVWDANVHVLPYFHPPSSWYVDRSFDWGSSKPFSVGWWAESDGSDITLPGGRVMSTVRGDLFRFAEWYGWTGKPNEGIKALATEVAKGILQREKAMRIEKHVRAGPADSSIFTVENGNCIGDDMEAPIRLEDGREYAGISWLRADKSPGSRKVGWEQVRTYLKQALPSENGWPRERPGLFITANCEQFIRTVPVLARSDKDPDDVDTETEDHIADEVRYKVRSVGGKVVSGKRTGH